MHEILAVRIDALHAELRCPCGGSCVVGDLPREQDGINAFLQGHRDHRSPGRASAEPRGSPLAPF